MPAASRAGELLSHRRRRAGKCLRAFLRAERSSGTDPSATMRPLAMIATRSQSRSTTSRTWEVMKTVAPRSTCSIRISFMSRAPSGSTPFERFVEQEQLRAMNQSAGQGEPFLHALGIAGDQGGSALLELEQLHQLARAAGGHVPREAVHAADELEKLAAGQPVEQRGFIGHHAHQALDAVEFLGHPHAQHLHFARCGGQQSDQNVDRGGLAGAVRPQEAEKASSRHFQVQAVQRGLVSVRFGQTSSVYGRGHVLECTATANY